MNYIETECKICGVLNTFEVPVTDYKNGRDFACGCGAHAFRVIEKNDEDEII